MTYLRLTSENDDVSSLAIAIKIESNLRVVLQICKTFGPVSDYR